MPYCWKSHALAQMKKGFCLFSFITKIPDIDVYAVDLRDWHATKALVEKLGPVDLLVNNAGNNILKSFLDVTKEDIDR